MSGYSKGDFRTGPLTLKCLFFAQGTHRDLLLSSFVFSVFVVFFCLDQGTPVLCLPMVRMAPIIWGALLAICSQHQSRSLDGGSAQMAVGHVGQLDRWWQWSWWYPNGWW